MTFGAMLGTFFIGPLKLIFESIFQLVYGFVQSPVIAIACLSLAMNFLVLPLYRRADAMQAQARDTEAALAKGIGHIKKTFSGNERMMMLQTYYRQNHYSPLNALRGSVSLLLEVPFFMAAYQFLSHLELLKGVPFGLIADLSLPDGLIQIGGTAINLLPILMTLINFASSAIYLKGFPLKSKVQIYGIAVVFLVLLYDSPAGLVFYWTLNNLFSLAKNICIRLAGEKKEATPARKRRWKACPKVERAPDRRLFIAAALFLTAFIGFLIPTNYIAACPQEYVDATYYFHPLWYAVSALLLAGGTFMLWFGVFYWLASPKGKVTFERVLWAFCGIAVVSYMLLGSRFGMVSADLRYQNGMEFPAIVGLVNLGMLALVSAALLLVLYRFPRLPARVLTVAVLAVAVMSAINVAKTERSMDELNVTEEDTTPSLRLSRDGKNVVVLFLDRAMGEYLPYIMQERPELQQTFSGFTYYSNAISFGGHTNLGAPAMLGGYEYTPVEMNKRDGELLKDKHNEALKVLPVMFLEAGYDVTVCDAPYANYKWIPDMSIYDDYPGIRTYITKGCFEDTEEKQMMIERNLRNFYCFSLTKSLPLCLQLVLYDGGNYLMAGQSTSVFQIRMSLSKARGMSEIFMKSYEVLANLDAITEVVDGDAGGFVLLCNDTTHEPMLLEEPSYTPSAKIDNTAYDKAHTDRFTLGDSSIHVENGEQMAHYQTNMATLIQVGRWLDNLRESGVYDNTRIIICSDHGNNLHQTEALQHKVGLKKIDVGQYFPLLMVKDFDSDGFTTSDTFMTNADVPVLAVKDVIADPVNPFTGKALTDAEKTAHDQFISTSDDWNTDTNDGTTFKASRWAVVTDNLWDRDDWQFITKKTVLKANEMTGE